MLLNFIEAADGTPLTKTFFKDEKGNISTKPYPFVKNFTSYSETVDSIDEFYAALVTHASKGRCLVKGNLTAQLVDEPRAGKTDPTEHTEYLVLDLDFAEGFESIDEFLGMLDPALSDVSYIFQHSSSSGIKCEPGLRGHVFVKLEHAQPPAIIKQWLLNRNMVVPALRAQVELSANQMGLRWPLDVTTCQNDKLIYIAEPITDGVDDNLQGSRFELRTKDKEAASLLVSANTAVNNELSANIVDELREKMGLKKRKARYKTIGNERVLTNPDEATVTSVQSARGFTYLNLNNGDSWGYFYPDDDPSLVFNFKGEPVVRLQDIAPEYYKSVKVEKSIESDGRKYFAIRDIETDTYWAGFYEMDTQRLKINQISSRQKIDEFMKSRGLPVPEYVEDWDIVFDPTTDVIIDPERKRINTLEVTEYMKHNKDVVGTIPRTINKILDSVCVDEATKEHFMNWLAHAFQTREKATTGWIFSGVQGTGKGLLLSKVLMPLFGHTQVAEITTDNLEDTFNGFLEQSLLLWVDEFSVNNSVGKTRILNKLKNLITENNVMVRRMRSNAVSRRFYANIIIATNHVDPIPIDENDRRLHIAPPQETPIQISMSEIEFIKEELPLFAAYLRNYNVNPVAVNTILRSEARTKMIKAGQTSVESFFDAIKHGDLDFFMQFVQEKAPVNNGLPYTGFVRAVKRWAANFNQEVLVTNEEMMNVYSYLQNQNTNPVKFGRMMKIYRVPITRGNLNGGRKRGVQTTFTIGDEDEINSFIQPDIREISNA